MIFDYQNPSLTDPIPAEEKYLYAWSPSLEINSYYAWVHRVTPDVQLLQQTTVVALGEKVKLFIYRGTTKQELLYRIEFGDTLPPRFMHRPYPFDLFWSFGKQGGTSEEVEYLFRDRYVSIHCWVDKKSYLAVLRQQHYAQSNFSFWSR